MIFLLDVPFSHRDLAKYAGARWNPKQRYWYYEGVVLPEKLATYKSQMYSPEAWAEADVNGAWVAAGPVSNITLRDHQQTAADAIVHAYRQRLPGFLLADEVGLGKTYAAISAIGTIGNRRKTNPLNILVLAPLSVVAHWRRAIGDFGDGGHRWCVTNYDRSKALLFEPASSKTAKRTRTKNKNWSQKGKAKTSWDIVICDESHRLKNPTAQRSAAVRQLIGTNRHGRRKTPAFTLWLSATAGQNPLELAYLAPLLSQRYGVKVRDLNDFEQWCQATGLGVKRGSFGKWEWAGDPSDLESVRSLLFEEFRPKSAPSKTKVLGALRRRPADLVGWPEMQRVLRPVSLDALQWDLYNAAWEEFRREMELIESGENPTNPLVIALRFRQKASLLRVRQTVEAAKDLIADGFRVAISAEFRETVTAIEEQLGTRTAAIHGGMPPEERETNRLQFQQGALDAIVFTVTEGISLHANEQAVKGDSVPRVLLLHDLRWSALSMAQIEGRTHRDGQAAIAYYLYAADTAEEKVAEAVVNKLRSMAVMLGDDTTGLDVLIAQVT